MSKSRLEKKKYRVADRGGKIMFSAKFVKIYYFMADK